MKFVLLLVIQWFTMLIAWGGLELFNWLLSADFRHEHLLIAGIVWGSISYSCGKEKLERELEEVL